MDAIAQTSFDYGSLASGIRKVVQKNTGEIRDRMKKAATDIVEIGERLSEVKNLLPHGQFKGWLEAEFEWSYESAAKTMQVFNKFKNVNFTSLSIAPSALYLLASPSTPEPVRESVLAEAQSGTKITHADVKGRVEAVRKSTPECLTEAQELNDADPDLQRYMREAAERDNKPRRAPADDALDGGTMDGLERRPSHIVTLAERQEQSLPEFDWSGTIKRIYQTFDLIEKRGGIDTLLKHWDMEDADDYLRTLRDIRTRCNEFIPKLEKRMTCVK